jgi:signal recognition particle GTPase
MLVGLQGSGKTTTAAKIANRLKGRERKKVLLASLDVQRPAAQEQLAVLGRQIGVPACRSWPAKSRWRSPAARSRPGAPRALTS